MRANPALGRPFDFSLPSNRFILIATPIIGAFAGLLALIRAETLADAFGWGFATGGAAFLAWAIGRELHPDRIWVATVAAFVAPWGVLLAEPDLLGSAVVLLVARAVVGTTGRSMRGADVVLFAAVGVPVAFRASGPGLLLLGALGLFASGMWTQRNRSLHLLTAAIYLAAGVAALFGAEMRSFETADSIVLGLGVFAGLISLLGPTQVAASCDRIGAQIAPSRVRMGRLIAVLAAAAASFSVAPASLGPVWAALMVTAIKPN
jgi:hypothetical protein